MQAPESRWEELLLAELDDLELVAEGLYLADRDREVAEYGTAEFAEVSLVARLHACVGRRVTLLLPSQVTAEGEVRRVGADWVLLASGPVESIVPLAAVLRVRGASGRAVDDGALPLSARLGVGSAVRRTVPGELSLTMADGSVVGGTVRRVGADFAEVVPEGTGQVELVPLAAVVVWRRLG